ncbi:sf-assemblin/beta giardin family protein [Babesia bovis T2Bo]|uniref:Sf-assemblin/beta giardin family protein n=1 Tax=Babesia bovis TaxID=5865 RepID=A7ATS6_BABBO|nr:sf-assemblin/beta giardin family protein [Babesia bovis T2Bo]EDO06337.1 sf-assemblin/beta giardin family protein [Babesia bovis T2Bo]|eukprot:XP_001609905.1 sf-assemblin/beta giardin family protein [Babesia bovis T2Bo]
MSDSELMISQGSQCSMSDSSFLGLGELSEPLRTTVVRNTHTYSILPPVSSGETGYVYRSPTLRQTSNALTIEGYYAQESDILRDLSPEREAKDPRFQGTTKSKLSILTEKLQGFERQMEFHAKQRRMHEEQRFLKISESLCNLDESITQESKRRLETIKALHGVFDSKIVSVQTNIENLFNDKFDRLESVMKSLTERIDAISNQSEDNEKILQDNLENNCVALEKNLATVQKLFESEKLARQEREEHIMKRMTELEMQTANAVGKEMQNVEKQYQDFKTELDGLKRQSESREKEIKEKVLNKLASLSNELTAEACARENADNIMTQALHCYMKVIADVSKLPYSE